jgi:hypothetical protein
MDVVHGLNGAMCVVVVNDVYSHEKGHWKGRPYAPHRLHAAGRLQVMALATQAVFELANLMVEKPFMRWRPMR